MWLNLKLTTPKHASLNTKHAPAHLRHVLLGFIHLLSSSGHGIETNVRVERDCRSVKDLSPCFRLVLGDKRLEAADGMKGRWQVMRPKCGTLCMHR